MNLQDYISEAISRGKHKYAPECNCTIKEMADWLESNGITGIITDSLRNISEPNIKDGELRYVIVTGVPQPWVSVYNKHFQRVTLSIGLAESQAWCDVRYSFGKESMSMKFEDGIECIERMIVKPNNRLTPGFLFDLKEKAQYTIEAISSRSNSSIMKQGLYTPEGMTEFLDSMGFRAVKRLPPNFNPKKPCYVASPHRYANTDAYSIEAKFGDKDNRVYWANFRTGPYGWARLIDVTDIYNSYTVETTYGNSEKSKDVWDNIIEFIEKCVA